MIGRFPCETSSLALAWAVMDLVIAGARGLAISGPNGVPSPLSWPLAPSQTPSKWPNLSVPRSQRRHDFSSRSRTRPCITPTWRTDGASYRLAEATAGKGVMSLG